MKLLCDTQHICKTHHSAIIFICNVSKQRLEARRRIDCKQGASRKQEPRRKKKRRRKKQPRATSKKKNKARSRQEARKARSKQEARRVGEKRTRYFLLTGRFRLAFISISFSLLLLVTALYQLSGDERARFNRSHAHICGFQNHHGCGWIRNEL